MKKPRTDQPEMSHKISYRDAIRSSNISSGGSPSERIVTKESLFKGSNLAEKQKAAESLKSKVEAYKVDPDNEESEKTTSEIKRKEINMDPKYWKEH